MSFKRSRADGVTIWIENLVRMVMWEGEPAVQVTAYDITERKRLETQLRQSQKMEAVGTLAGGMAHEFNNVLNIITTYQELAQLHIPREHPALPHFEVIQTAVNRATDLIKQILTFSRQTEISYGAVNLSALIQEIMGFLRRTLPASISLVHAIDEDLIVWADATQMYQVIMNLCANAEYAMRDRHGVIEVRLEGLANGLPSQIAVPDAPPQAYVKLSIQDTGPGVASEIQDQIFDPFFTTKGIGEGTGMGLAIVHGIVTGHGGLITLDSPPGGGATFSLYLPQLQERETVALLPESTFVKGGACILFVDDETLLTQGVKVALSGFGYEVVTHTSPREALAEFASAPQRFDLVVTDQTMPEMTGEQLIQELKQRRPDIPIILCTGFSHIMDANTAHLQGIDAFCMKPLSTKELSTQIELLLSRRVVE